MTAAERTQFARARAALVGMASNRDLARVHAAWAVNTGTHHAENVALTVLVLDAYGLGALALLALARALPAAVAGTTIVALVADVAPGRVLAGALGMRAALAAALAVSSLAGAPLLLVLTLAALDAATDAVYWPAQSALLPRLSSTPAELTTANLATTTVENVGTLVGPAVAGLLLAFAGDAAVFLVVVVFLAGAVVVVPPLPADPAAAGAPPPGSPMTRGIRALLGERDARRVVALYLLHTFSLGALGVLVALIAVDLIGWGDAGIGYLHAVIGVGGLVGSIGTLALVGTRHLARTMTAALIGWGVALVLVAVAPPVVGLAAVLLALVGWCDALVDVSALTLLQRIVRERELGAALGAFEGLWWGVLGLGAVAAAAAVRLVGLRPAIAAVGALLAVAAVLHLRRSVSIDARTVAPARQLAALATVPWFAGQPPLALERLAFELVPLAVPAGTVVIREGEAGDRLYLIEDGVVDVVGKAVLGPGDWFGEIALLYDVPRTATVTARTDASLYALERAAFLAAVTARSEHGEAATALASGGSAR